MCSASRPFRTEQMWLHHIKRYFIIIIICVFLSASVCCRRVCSRGRTARHPVQTVTEKRESWEGTRKPWQDFLLLAEHVQDQVAHTVAVAELVVVPADTQRAERAGMMSYSWEEVRFSRHQSQEVTFMYNTCLTTVQISVLSLNNSPWNQLDKVLVECDASAGVKDGGVRVAVEVCGHDLSRKRRRS